MASARDRQILLVEDTALLARSYIQYLRNEPYSVELAATGSEALSFLAGTRRIAFFSIWNCRT